MARILALDLGEKRVGVSLSDETQTIAQTMDFMLAAELIEQLKVLLQKFEVEKILFGLPVSMDGKEHAQAARIRQQAALVKEAIDLPYEFIDERLTSVSALKILQDLNVKDKKQEKDSLSAQILLQNYLDAQHV